ncbi:MAG TPA: hypothetical protein VFK05_25670 [Polyangiaceae bacterium]|nr:hypothetical protein [Polyangiaceae bacterium]
MLKTAEQSRAAGPITLDELANSASVSVMTASRWRRGHRVRDWARNALERAWVRLGGVVISAEDDGHADTAPAQAGE